MQLVSKRDVNKNFLIVKETKHGERLFTIVTITLLIALGNLLEIWVSLKINIKEPKIV